MHNKSVEEVLKELNTSYNGLSNLEAEERIEKYGRNVLPEKKKANFLLIFVKQLLDPIVILLVITVIFSLIIGEVIDAVAIIFIILVDLIMGTVQEFKAEKTAESLSKLVEVKVLVKRDGKDLLIDSKDVTIGDIVYLKSGDKVSADHRIIESDNLQVDEAVLTGESIQESKNNKVIEEKTPLGDRTNMVYAGTTITKGRATAVVTSIGSNTEIGKIAFSVHSTKETKSPLTIRMEKFSKQISILVIIIAIILTILLYFKNVDGKEIFLSVIALSVSAMPEGLPLALTMALTIASNKMAKKNVIVKKLNSVESLGSCTVIATDKTGTLTLNEQTAKKIVFPEGNINLIDGIGYNLEGKIQCDDENRTKNLALLGFVNNESIVKKKENLEVMGNSIDIAFKILGYKAGIESEEVEIIKLIPYESENKYSAAFYKKDGKVHCTVKGSLEKILAYSSTMNENGNIVNLDINKINNQNENLAKEGFRVIALADAIIEEKDDYNENDIKDLCFMGLVAFIDPVRKEVKKAIEECQTAGIKVSMITGDHPLTAFAIAKELTLASNYQEVTTGEEVELFLNKGKEEFDKFVSKKRIFTRVTPLQKLEIVESYKRQGEFIAVTGDGVNDAPALKAANIGVAMGSGTDVAKETASMIILDDNFKSIVAGIKEGRNAYSNIRKVSYMLLSCGLAEVLFFILSILFNLPMPLVAIQLLWLNIVTDGLQDFALSFEKAEKDIMNEKPRNVKDSIFNKELLIEVLIAGLTIGLVVFFVWYECINVLHIEESIARGYIMALMVFLQNMHVLNCRSERTSIFKLNLLKNPLIIFSIVSSIVLQFIVMEVETLSVFLKTHSVPIDKLLYLFALSTIVLIVMEIYKYFKRKYELKSIKN